MSNEYCEKNILVIGNGFDLYHRLPTRYTDFLFFVKNFSIFFDEYNGYDAKNIAEKSSVAFEISLTDIGKLTKQSIKDFLKYKEYFNPVDIEYLSDQFRNNAWIEYFLQTNYVKEGWIDFENEIEKVLKSIEEYYSSILPNFVGIVPNTTLDLSISTIIRIFGKKAKEPFKNRNLEILRGGDISPKKLRQEKLALVSSMKEELDGLIKCLYTFFNDFVSSIKNEIYSPDIESIGDIHLLNFNYTNTYLSIYGSKNIKECHSVHGDLRKNNLVLGVSDDAFDNLDYIYFQKYFQRIQKKTGVLYKKWLDDNFDISGDIPINIYIMGHSLSKTDKGIFQDLFKNENVSKLCVYYYSQTAYEGQVLNLIDMFGKDYVIEQTAIERIEFIELKPPKEKLV